VVMSDYRDWRRLSGREPRHHPMQCKWHEKYRDTGRGRRTQQINDDQALAEEPEHQPEIQDPITEQDSQQGTAELDQQPNTTSEQTPANSEPPQQTPSVRPKHDALLRSLTVHPCV
jgi:hypothetical protein